MNQRQRPQNLGFVQLVPLAGLLVLGGCVNVLHPYNQPSQQKLRVESPQAEAYTIRVADQRDYPVPPDGRVVVEVPPLERGCAAYLLGVVKVKDSSPHDVQAFDLKKSGRTVRRLSLNEIAKLRVDGDGYHLIKLE